MIGWIIWAIIAIILSICFCFNIFRKPKQKRYFFVSFSVFDPTTKLQGFGNYDFIVKSLGHINQAECIAQIKDSRKELGDFQIVIQNIHEFECGSDYNEWSEKKA